MCAMLFVRFEGVYGGDDSRGGVLVRGGREQGEAVRHLHGERA